VIASTGQTIQTSSPSVYKNCVPKLPDAFTFSATGRAVTLDWIHVYQQNP
jgi:hypothetical protein